jgi:hypothetical protein
MFCSFGGMLSDEVTTLTEAEKLLCIHNRTECNQHKGCPVIKGFEQSMSRAPITLFSRNAYR